MTNYDTPENIKNGIDLIKRSLFFDEKEKKELIGKNGAEHRGVKGTSYVPTDIPLEAYADTIKRLVDKKYQKTEYE